MLRCLMIAVFLALSSVTDAADVIKTVTLEVQGMNCAACPATVKKALKNVPGVSDAKVNYKSRIAEVDYDPNKTSADELAKAVTTVGYPTTVKGVH
jgi:periplasmic mercuric ion binding protein